MPHKPSALDTIAENLSTLQKAEALQEHAAQVGFEWQNITRLFDKFEEEIQEMRAAIINKDKENQIEELGDLLFLLVNYGRMLGISGEAALRRGNEKFERRFRGLEGDLQKDGRPLSQASFKQMEQAWQAQKAKEGKPIET